MKNLKILLAEDDENLGTLLNTFLKAKGFDVELARNGKLALQKFTEAEFDFLIFDVMMPEMDGFTLAKEIRELDKKTPILFLTAKSMKEDKLEGFKIGADDYLTKPFSMEELLARIEAILRRTA
ncbi:response regulator transcription factor, partial [Lishizhenia sp.]